MSEPSDARDLTQQRIIRLFETYKAEGLEPNEAAARAVREIKRASSSSSSAHSSKVTPSSSAPPVDAPSSHVVERLPTLPVTSSDSEEEIQLASLTNRPAHAGEPFLSSSQESLEPSTEPLLDSGQARSSTNHDSPQRPFATTTAVEFLEHLKSDAEADEIGALIGDIFGSFCNLAHSFQIPVQVEAAEAMEVDQSPPTPTADDAKIDWDGLKRVYDEIESQSALELVLIEAIKKSRLQRDSVTPHILHIAVAMTLVNPHIASPSYLDSAFIGICRICAELNEPGQIHIVKILSRLAPSDLLQIVRNVQQSLTIRCLEIDEGVDVHEDERIGVFVRTLRLLFFAALFGQAEDDDWRTNLKKLSAVELEQPSLEELESSAMETDAAAAASHMTEDDEQINKLIHATRGAKTTEEQDPLAKLLKLDWCNISRPRIPYHEFLNETINNALDVEKDFVNYKFNDESILNMNDTFPEMDIFSFMKHPFILNTKEKTMYLFYDSRVKQIQQRRLAQHVLRYTQNLSVGLPYLILKVSRDNIIRDALIRLEVIAADNPSQLQKQLVVEFDGEEGVDEGGVSKEFFTLVLQEILKPDYGMFRFNEDTGYHQFNAVQFQETEKEYLLIGMLLGLAIYNGINLDIAFPTVIFKKLLGYEGTFEDLEFSHPDIYRSLTQLLEADKDSVESMALTFSTTLTSMFGEVVEYDLIKGGADRPVNNLNKFQFVEVYADFLLNKSIKKSFNAFKRGFELVTDNSPLPDLFRPEELESLVIGQRKYDWETLQEICEYDGGFSKNHETIQHFWSVFDEMDESDKKLLLEFFTGSDRVPVGGLCRLKPKIQSSGPDSDRLPTAHTCFNILLLPAYKSREKLKERLTKAIENAKGFGMI